MKEPPVYRLTNAQRKELLVRGTEILVALPVPLHDLDDPVEWARSVLEPGIQPLVTAAEERDLWVRAIRSPSDSLGGHLGRIVPGDPQGEEYIQTVVAVVATLTPQPRRHRSQRGPTWPHSVYFGGQWLPGKGARP